MLEDVGVGWFEDAWLGGDGESIALEGEFLGLVGGR